MISYPDSVRYLYSLGNEVRTIKLGLERIRALLTELDSPEKCCRWIHIAGTNGKGSVAAMIESALRASGIRTGLFTSPHLMEPTERIQVAGRPVSKKLFVEAFNRVHRTAERMHRDGALDMHPTYFETVTAMAFVLFRELGAERVALETGLGGRLDATNVVTPELSVITQIDYDHEAYLGNTLKAIATEKAGIFKPGVPVVVSAQRPRVLPVLRELAATAEAPFVEASGWKVEDLSLERNNSRFTAASKGERIPLQCPLAGAHQVENAITAVSALRRIGIGAGAVRAGIRRTKWPGRLETVREAPEIILDGAHNPGGIRALARHIERFYKGRRIRLIYGAMRDKSLDEIAGILSPLASEIVLTNPASHRALRPEILRKLFRNPAVRVAGSTREALSMVEDASPEEAIFITGSLMLVGEARGLLLG